MCMTTCFRQILAVGLTLGLQCSVNAQTTEDPKADFKFCMRTCVSNSCSGPASVVEKNCTRKCSTDANTSSFLAAQTLAAADMTQVTVCDIRGHVHSKAITCNFTQTPSSE